MVSRVNVRGLIVRMYQRTEEHMEELHAYIHGRKKWHYEGIMVGGYRGGLIVRIHQKAQEVAGLSHLSHATIGVHRKMSESCMIQNPFYRRRKN